MEDRRQTTFDQAIDKVLPEVEHDLRKKKYLLIDAKSAKNIRNKQVSFKVFDEQNSINEYMEPDESLDELAIDPYSTDLYDTFEGEQFQFLDN